MERDDVRELKEVLDVVSDRIPGFLRELRDVMYSRKAAEGMADAVATFYKKLVDGGIPKDAALEMARGYMINLSDILGEGVKFGHHQRVEIKREKEENCC